METSETLNTAASTIYNKHLLELELLKLSKAKKLLKHFYNGVLFKTCAQYVREFSPGFSQLRSMLAYCEM